MNAVILFEPAGRVGVVFAKLLDDVAADIGVVFLDALCNSDHIFGRNVGGFSSLSEKLLGEEGKVFACDGDVLDGGSNHITVCNWNNVSDAIT